MAVSFGGAKELIVNIRSDIKTYKSDVEKTTAQIIKLKDRQEELSNAIKKGGSSADKAAKQLDKVSNELAEQEANIKKLSSGWSLYAKIAGSVVGAGVAMAGGLVALAVKAGQTALEIRTLAEQSGTSAENIQILEFAYQNLGIKLEDAQDLIRDLNVQMSLAIVEGGDLAKIFNFMGISVRNTDGSLRDSFEVLKDVSDAFRDTVPPAQRAGLAAKLFGEDMAARVMPALLEGGDALEEFGRQLSDNNALMSNDTVNAAAEATVKLRAMWDLVQNQLIGALAQLAPQILGFVQALISSLPVIGQWAERVANLFGLSFAPIDAQLDNNSKAIKENERIIKESMSEIDKLNNGSKGMFDFLGIGPSEIEMQGGAITAAQQALEQLRKDRQSLEEEKASYDNLMERFNTTINDINKPIDFTPINTEGSGIVGGGGGGGSKGKGKKPEKTEEEKRAEALRRYLQDMQKNIEAQRQLSMASEQYSTAIDGNVVRLSTLQQVTEAGFEVGTSEFDMAVQLTEAYRKQKEVIDELIKKKEEAGPKFKSFGESFNEQVYSMAQASQDAGARFGGFFNDLIDGAVRGQLNFKEMALSIVQDLTAMILKALFWKAISGMFGGDAGGILGSLFGGFGGASANGNVFSGGNVVPFANGGVVGGPTFFPMSGGRAGLMGEAGPEAIMPLTRGSDGKLGVAAEGMGGGGQMVSNVFNTTINPGPNQSPADARKFAEEFNRSIDQRISQTMIRQGAKGRSTQVPQRRVGIA